MIINRNEFITAFAFLLDFLETEAKKSMPNYNKRVCLISVRLGEILGLDSASLYDLYAYAIFHNNGISCDIDNTLLNNKKGQLKSALCHCIQGEKNLACFPFLKKHEGIIQYHHEFYDGSGLFGICGDDIPLFSQIIIVADIVTNLYQKETNKDVISSIIKKYKGIKFAPVVCEAFVCLEQTSNFWLSLYDTLISNELKKYESLYDLDLQLSELIPITEILSRLADAKSAFSSRHSEALSNKAAIMSDFYGFNERTKIKLIIASHLHDIGKLAIPGAILDKNGELTENELSILKSHSFYTRKALEAIKGMEDITEWSSNHHEKLNGTGYPFGLSELNLSYESQLIACLNIYQSLTENSSSRSAYSHKKAKKIMEEMSKHNEISKEIVADIGEHLK